MNPTEVATLVLQTAKNNRYDEFIGGGHEKDGSSICERVDSELSHPEPTTKNLYTLYKNNPLAEAIINKPVNETWKEGFCIRGSEEFNEAIRVLNSKIDLRELFKKADRLSSIGDYGVIALGLKGNSDSKAKSGKTIEDIAWSRVYPEIFAQMGDVVKNDKDSGRTGLPKDYEINGKTYDASRIIHVSDGSESRFRCKSRLYKLYKYICNVDILCGGATVMYWKNAAQVRVLGLDNDAELGIKAAQYLQSPEFTRKVEAEIEKMERGASKYVKAFGYKMEQLSGEFFSPKEPIDCQLEMISIGSDIPKRMLTGSEVGERSSQEDAKRWKDFIKGRKKDKKYIPMLYINKLIELKVLPSSEYTFKFKMTDEEKREAEERKSQKAKCLKSIVSSLKQYDSLSDETKELYDIGRELENINDSKEEDEL